MTSTNIHGEMFCRVDCVCQASACKPLAHLVWSVVQHAVPHYDQLPLNRSALMFALVQCQRAQAHALKLTYQWKLVTMCASMLVGVQTEVASANKGQTSINGHLPIQYLFTYVIV